MGPDIDDVRAAAGRLTGIAHRAPLLESDLLNLAAGRRVLVKAECLQRSGSFKFRGAWSALSAMDPEVRRRGVIAYSSGNHAQGIALAARLLGARATIVMPNDAPALKILNTKSYGARVRLYDRRGGESREEIGARLAEERGLTLVRPYDEPLVIAGQGTCGLEIAEQAQAAGVRSADVLVPCGGGGLTAGIALALAAEAPQLRPRTCEPAGFDDVARSLRAGERLTNDGGASSVADAILTPSPGELTFPILRAHCGPGLVVSDDEMLRAMWAALVRLKIALEPGGAAALAAALFRRDAVAGDAVIVVASGGNVEPAHFARGARLAPP